MILSFKVHTSHLQVRIDQVEVRPKSVSMENVEPSAFHTTDQR